jgi:FMN phosphatase YigB (HAD superfamily)
MRNINIVVFDVGGVLLDWKAGLASVSRLISITPEDLLNTLGEYLEDLELGNISDDYFWQQVCNKHFYMGNYMDLLDSWRSNQPLMPAGWDLAKHLFEMNIPLAICTNNWLGVMEFIIKKYPEFVLFGSIIDSSQEKIRKPDCKIYELVEKEVGYSGKEILFIDDSIKNIEAAEAFGWNTYLYLGNDFDTQNKKVLDVVNG